MVVVRQEGASEDNIQNVINKLMNMGFHIHRSTGARHTAPGAVGTKADFDTRDIELLEGVEEVVRITAPYKLASRHFNPEGTRGAVWPRGHHRRRRSGGNGRAVQRGKRGTDRSVAASVAARGARVLRGGAFKPRTSPYSFQGSAQKGLELMRPAADRHKLAGGTEVMDHTRSP